MYILCLSEQTTAFYAVTLNQGITKRCRLSWLTNSALVYEPICTGGGGALRGISQWVKLCTITWSPNKLWRSKSILLTIAEPRRTTCLSSWYLRLEARSGITRFRIPMRGPSGSAKMHTTTWPFSTIRDISGLQTWNIRRKIWETVNNARYEKRSVRYYSEHDAF